MYKILEISSQIQEFLKDKQSGKYIFEPDTIVYWEVEFNSNDQSAVVKFLESIDINVVVYTIC
jgi:hypothetical protein